MMADSLSVFTALPWTDQDHQLGMSFTMSFVSVRKPDSMLQDGNGPWAISFTYLYSF